MRSTTPLRSRVLAALALAFAAACADSSVQPTAPDGQRLRSDLIGEATASADSTIASTDSATASADSAVVDGAAVDSASAGTTATTTSSDTTASAPADSGTTTAPAAGTDTTSTTTTTDTSTVGIVTLDEPADDLLSRPNFLVPQPLVCPSDEQLSDQAVIGPDGGTIGVRGTSITIPAGAVAEPTLFEVILPASPYMETEIHAVGAEHFFFAQPATITISYARCAADALPETANPQGAYIDSNSKKILELMGGEVDRVGRKVSFSTGHLSGYIVAF